MVSDEYQLGQMTRADSMQNDLYINKETSNHKSTVELNNFKANINKKCPNFEKVSMSNQIEDQRTLN